MADGKYLDTKIREVLVATSKVADIVGSRVYNGDGRPIDIEFPQLIYKVTGDGSEPVIPAKYVTLELWLYLEKTHKRPLSTIHALFDAVRDEINRNNGEPFNEIDQDANEGLRVVKCLKNFEDAYYVDDEEKHVGNALYSLVQSESEDFRDSVAGDVAWDNTP